MISTSDGIKKPVRSLWRDSGSLLTTTFIFTQRSARQWASLLLLLINHPGFKGVVGGRPTVDV